MVTSVIEVDGQAGTASSLWRAFNGDVLVDCTVGGLLAKAASDAPDAIALVEGVGEYDVRRRWTYAQLLEESLLVADALLGDFEPGERIAVWANNIPEWVFLQFGCAFAGMTLVTADPSLQQRELRHLLRASQAVGLFYVSQYRGNPMEDHLAAVRGEGLDCLRVTVRFSEWERYVDGARGRDLPRVDPDGSAQIQFTSGTTGDPKGVVLSHRGIINSANLSYTQRLRLQTGEAIVNTMPLFHTAGCVLATLGAVWGRCAHVLMPRFDASVFLRLIAEERSVILCGVPTMLQAVLALDDAATTTDTSSLRCAVTGGAAVPPDLVSAVEDRFGVPLAAIYAQTEASPAISMIDPINDTLTDRTHTVGRPIPAIDVAVLGDDGRPVPIGSPGELCTRGFHVMIGYLDMPEATAAAVDEQGWLHTGDVARMDGRGYLTIVGRIKEMIIRGGENIFPREIEAVLACHPDVVHAAVVGAPDSYWGEVPVAYVQRAPASTIDGEQLEVFAESLLARHKVPRRWRFVDAMPLTSSGKISKRALSDALVGGSGT